LILTGFFPLLASGMGKTNENIQAPSVSLSLLTERPLTIGDSIDIAVTVYHGKKEKIEYPRNEEEFNPFILKELRVKKGRTGKGLRRTMIIYTLTLYRTGTFTLKPLRIMIDGKELFTKEMKITILSVLPEEIKNPELKEISPPIYAGIKPLFILLLISGVCASLALFLYLKYFFKKHKISTPKPKHGISVVDPFRYSLDQLKELRTGFRKKRLNTREVYFSISYILRFFIGSHLNIHALQMTTRELEDYLKNKEEYNVPTPLLLRILNRSDMVKFARENPLSSNVEGDIEKSINIVKKVGSPIYDISEPPEKEGEVEENGL